MQRRTILQWGGGLAASASVGWWMPALAADALPPRVLILIELRGGNDALNTVVPVDDGRYRDLRPRLALAEDAVVRLEPTLALHGALSPWAALWSAKEMAVVQGVGYPGPNLSHFRSVDIWDTASDSAQYLTTGWITRAASGDAMFSACGADGVSVGVPDLGPLAGGARAVALQDPERFARQAKLASPDDGPARGALAHVLRVEADIARAATALVGERSIATEFPRSAFGAAARTAALVASTGRVPVVRLSLNGFDTHIAQLPRQQALLRELAAGVMALRAALRETGTWDRTLVLTTSEFGRRPRENGSAGTDHGTAGVLFAFGPLVRAGLHGEPPSLSQLDADGNLRHTVDFRRVYAGVLSRWWQIEPRRVLGRSYDPLDLVST